MTKISFNGDFFDADYFERGRETGKGWLENYRWMPKRTFKEALGIIDYMGLTEKHSVIDVGCAKGFMVKALRQLGIKADGCDISDYALSFAPKGCWNCSDKKSWNKKYTHAIAKDMLEHNKPAQLKEVLKRIKSIAPIFLCIVPLGDNGKYRIPEYHTEITHYIIEDEIWWKHTFEKNGWKIKKCCHTHYGIKENWSSHADGKGNGIFLLEAV